MKSTVINQQLLLLNSAAIIPVNLMQKIDMQIKEKVDPPISLFQYLEFALFKGWEQVSGLKVHCTARDVECQKCM